MKIATAICCVMPVVLAMGHAVAQPFPTKPVRVINPAAPGGNGDILFRQLSPRMGEVLGQSLIAAVTVSMTTGTLQ